MPVIVNEFESLPEPPAAGAASASAPSASPPAVPPPAPRPAERSAEERATRWREARAARVRAC
jgi:hypothetical protein